MGDYKIRKENRRRSQESKKRRMPKHGTSVRKIIRIQIERAREAEKQKVGD